MVLAMATFRHCYREYRRKRETLEILLSRLRVGEVEDTSIERKEIIATNVFCAKQTILFQ